MTTATTRFDASTLPRLDAASLKCLSPAAERLAKAKRSGVTLDAPRRYSRRIDRRRFLFLSKVDKAAEFIGTMPAAGQDLHVVTSPVESFGTWHLVGAFLQLMAPATITSLTAASLGFSADNIVDLFARLDSGEIGVATVLLST